MLILLCLWCSYQRLVVQQGGEAGMARLLDDPDVQGIYETQVKGCDREMERQRIAYVANADALALPSCDEPVLRRTGERQSIF
jgi:hypothetical protein